MKFFAIQCKMSTFENERLAILRDRISHCTTNIFSKNFHYVEFWHGSSTSSDYNDYDFWVSKFNEFFSRQYFGKNFPLFIASCKYELYDIILYEHEVDEIRNTLHLLFPVLISADQDCQVFEYILEKILIPYYSN